MKIAKTAGGYISSELLEAHSLHRQSLLQSSSRDHLPDLEEYQDREDPAVKVWLDNASLTHVQNL